MSSLEAILGSGAPPAGPDLPPAIPDPEPHLSPAPEAAPPEAEPTDPQQQEVESLKTMLGMSRDYLSISTVEPSEAVKMKKIELLLHELLADNQKGQDALTGANPALRKALGGGA